MNKRNGIQIQLHDVAWNNSSHRYSEKHLAAIAQTIC